MTFGPSLAEQCGLATNYTAVGTPSLPNYIAALSGSAQGVTDDNQPASHPLSVASLYTQLAMAGLQWGDYESLLKTTEPLLGLEVEWSNRYSEDLALRITMTATPPGTGVGVKA